MSAKKVSKNSKITDTVDKAVNNDQRALMAAANAKLAKIIQPEELPMLDSEAKEDQDLSIPLYSTGILAVDDALSGGLPVGRMVELYGEEGSGKSLISLVSIAEMQKNGGRCLFFDVESAYDPGWAHKLGVQTDKLMVSDANVAEDVFKIVETYAESKLVDLIVIDSIANLINLDIKSAELGAARFGGIAGVLARILPRVHKTLKRNNVNLILINQVRETMEMYGPKLRTPGGRNLKHLFHTRIKCNKANASQRLKDGDTVTGVETSVQVTKHRGGANYTTATFRIDYKKGLDRVYDIVSYLLANNHITRSGAFYTYGGKKYQGINNLLDAFASDEAAFNEAVAYAHNQISRKKPSEPEQVQEDSASLDVPESDVTKNDGNKE